MKSASLFGVVAMLSLAAPSFGQASHAAPAPSVSAPRSRPAIAHPASVHGASHAAAYSNSAPIRPFDVYGVGNANRIPVLPVSPGGFVNPLAGTNRRGQRNNGNALILFGAGYGYGYPFDYSDSSGDDSQGADQANQGDQQQSGAQQQPQYIFVQQVPGPGGPNQAQFQGSQTAPPQQAVEPQQEPEPPLPDVGSFTLVTRYGVELDAVAFTRSSDQIVYITPEGGRRTLAFEDLDVNETQRLNSERGTPVDLSKQDDPAPAKSQPKPLHELTD